ncbi:oligoendopeptidase F [Paenibacillus sp. SC116]|uniref:oligoendopeptidase F n=1 Tax=Paenibacillus sp. SC116 TaxID=2968986 RepID=UPI00215AF6B9|nr:oligoendopeptidase F [Paenibacillus sp. SC116]MCR8845132.1 oligoendopeptidase F [Paenibacillus sp. SC116]
MEKRLTRTEVPVEATWRLEDLFETHDAWEAALKAIQEDVPTVTKYRGKLHEGAHALLGVLTAQEELLVRVYQAHAYAYLHLSADSTNSNYQTDAARMGDIGASIMTAMTFIRSEILSLPEGTIESYLEEEPELAPFRKTLLDLLAKKPHQLSPETESALASLSEVLESPFRIYKRGKLSDMSFDSVDDGEGNTRPVSFALFENKYEMSSDTTLRRNAYASFSSTLREYQNTFAETYATQVKKQVIMSRLRGYESVTHMMLEPQDVTLEMYHNILDIIQAELAPHMRRYAKLKQRELGLEQMRFCDLKAPLDADFSPSITFDEAGKLVQDALQVLGTEYSDIMHSAFTERWIDYADNVGKSTGAFCSSTYGAHSYVLVSWADNMRGAFTLAHEVGHAGHFMLAGRYQRFVNTRPSLYFIEAPSTMNELLLAQHIMKQSDDKRMKRWVITQLLNTYYHNFVTHLLEGELQRRVYSLAMQDVPLNAKKLNDLKGEVLSSFWGDAVELDDDAKMTWMRQPHYYMSLYPYTYAAGLTASTAAAQLITEQGQPAVDRWLEALKAGGTLSPLELMKLAGVDMSGPEPIRSAVAYVGGLVDQLEQLFESEL